MASDVAADDAPCPACRKPMALCVCADIRPIENRAFMLILQHPQEQDRDLGTARLAALHLTRAAVRIGLSWPNLTKALGRPADPKNWGVLYLGPVHTVPDAAPVSVLDRAGAPLGDAAGGPILRALDGIVLLDGSWSQAKTLWWRNPWLLKLQRIVLSPTRPSRYGRVRKEPRRDSLSTLEAAALAMARIEANPAIDIAMNASFETLLRRWKDYSKGVKVSA
jgi:DTW domain-containing protein YfiP